jgi:hypothetical protein
VRSLTSFALVIGLPISWAGQRGSVKSAARGYKYNKIFATNKILSIQSLGNNVVSLTPSLEVSGPVPVECYNGSKVLTKQLKKL